MAGSIVVKNRPLGHYVISVFSLLFRNKFPHEGKICISAPSRTIGRATDLANLLSDKFAPNILAIENVKLGRTTVPDLPKISTIEIFLEEKHYTREQDAEGMFKDFLKRAKKSKTSSQEFSICEIEFILATLLKEGYEFSLSCPSWRNIELRGHKAVKGNEIDLGNIKENLNGDILYNPISENNKSLNIKNNQSLISNGVEPALMRMGILQSPAYEKLAKDICQHDDVIFAVDTNMFYKCQITSALLDSFVGIARANYLDTPNWITVIASTVSIGELEHKANMKPSQRDDKLSFRERREACRGLQEFLEIGYCVDLEGVSILLTGDIPSELNFSSSGSATIRDEIIRRHLKEFFKTIDFHKGVYFLTQDKICEMFAKAEGLNAFYLPRKNLDPKDFPYHLTYLGKARDMNNISELIYELGIQYPLVIKCEGKNLQPITFKIETDWKEKSIEAWGNRRIKLNIGIDLESIKSDINQLKRERKKFKQKAENLSKEGIKNINKKIQEINKKISGMEEILKQNATAGNLIERLEKNGKRIGLNDLLNGWKEVNSERHII